MDKIIAFIFLFSYCGCSSQTIDSLELVVPVGHTQLPSSINFSFNSKYVLTGGDQTAKLWEAKSGRMIYTLSGHSFPVKHTLFSSDDKYILTVSALEVRLWQVNTGALIDNFAYNHETNFRDHLKPWEVNFLSFSDLKTHLMNLKKFSFNGTELHTYDTEQKHILWQIAPLTPSKVLFDEVRLTKKDSSLLDKESKLPIEQIIAINKRTIESRVQLKNKIDTSKQSPDKKILIIGTKNNLLQIWNLLNGKMIKSIKLRGIANYVLFSKNGQFAMVAGTSIRPFLINTDNWRQTNLSFYVNIGWATFSDDERFLIIPNHNKVVLYDIESEQELKFFHLSSTYFHAVRLSPNNEYLLTTSVDNTIRLWSVETETQLLTLEGNASPLRYAELSNNGQYLVTWTLPLVNQKYNHTKVWSMKTGRIVHSIPTESSILPRFSPDSKSLLVRDQSYSTKLLDLATGNEVTNIISDFWDFKSFLFSKHGEFMIGVSADGLSFWKTNNPLHILLRKKILKLQQAHLNIKNNLLYTLSDRKRIQIWSFPQMELLDSLEVRETNNLTISPNDDYIALATNNGNLRIYDLISKQQYEIVNIDKIQDFKFSSDGKKIVTISRDNTGAIIHTTTGMIVKKLIGHTGWLSCLAIHPTEEIIATGSEDNTIKLWSLHDGKLLKTLKGHLATVKSIQFNTATNRMVSASMDGTCRVWELSGKEVGTFIGIKNNESVCLIPDKYFLGTKEATKILQWKDGLKLYNFEQFDLQFNRPDLVLKQLSQSNKKLIEAYFNAYKKRLSKMGIRDKDFTLEVSLPKIIIAKDTLASISTNEPIANIFIEAIDKQRILNRIDITVNDVPLHGNKGIDLIPYTTKSWKQNVQFVLSKGENKIQVSVLNQGGAESLKETFYITYDAPKSKPTLYLIGIAADDFSNDNLDLTYPTKDIQDWVATYTTPTDKYQRVVTKTLYNNDISKGNLQTLKATLQQSQVDDQVILFVAGHGLLDDSLNFYLATPTTDFNNPAKGGILYEDLENLLDGIPARQKLFLLDACHSGEIDKEETEIVQQEMAQEDSIILRSFTNVPQPKNLGLANSFELMKQLFVDLRRGTGATVISSASGVEFARESKKWNNSVFTYCLLSGLTENKLGKTTKKADLNEDGKIMVSELQQYLAVAVPKETKGHQQPTMRVENISNDWRVW